jgi:general secretion pathway protein J
MGRQAQCARKDGERGFTLLEVLVAILLLALVVAGLLQGTWLSLRAWEAGEARLIQGQRTRAIATILARDLRTMAGARRTRPGQQAAGFLGEPGRLQFVAGPAAFPRHAWQTLPRLVGYAIEGRAASGAGGLVRREQPPLHPDAADAATWEAVSLDPLATEVRFRYLAPASRRAGRGAPRWVDAWDPNERPPVDPANPEQEGENAYRLPLAIEVTVIERDRQGQPVERPPLVVPIPVGTSL